MAAKGDRPSSCYDWVAVEEPLEIWVSFHHHQTGEATVKKLFSTMRTPADDINLVTGWFYTSGALTQPTDILSIKYTGSARLKNQPTNQVLVTLAPQSDFKIEPYQRLEVVNSACGVCGQQNIEDLLERIPVPSRPIIPLHSALLAVNAVYSLAMELGHQQAVFSQTGGIHGAALFDLNLQVVDVREDVGRHNALDKLIGANAHSLFKSLADPASGQYPASDRSGVFGVVLSGRVSFELVQKAAMANICYIVAMGAPSSLAIDLALECDICLIGFVKSSGFNVYSGQAMLSF